MTTDDFVFQDTHPLLDRDIEEKRCFPNQLFDKIICSVSDLSAKVREALEQPDER